MVDDFHLNNKEEENPPKHLFEYFYEKHLALEDSDSKRSLIKKQKILFLKKIPQVKLSISPADIISIFIRQKIDNLIINDNCMNELCFFALF